MKSRDEAIQAAAKAWFFGGPLGVQLDRSDIGRLLDAAVPVLLNDLADRIEDERMGDEIDDWNVALIKAAETVRAAAADFGPGGADPKEIRE